MRGLRQPGTDAGHSVCANRSRPGARRQYHFRSTAGAELALWRAGGEGLAFSGFFRDLARMATARIVGIRERITRVLRDRPSFDSLRARAAEIYPREHEHI